MPDVLQIQRPDAGEPNPPHWPDVPYGGNPPRRKTDGGRVILDWRAVLAVAGALLIVGLPLGMYAREHLTAWERYWFDEMRRRGFRLANEAR